MNIALHIKKDPPTRRLKGIVGELTNRSVVTEPFTANKPVSPKMIEIALAWCETHPHWEFDA